MKTKLIGLFLILTINATAYQYSYEKNHYWSRYKEAIVFRQKFRSIISFLKVREGYSAVVYKDDGWDCQCYGQRLAFYDRKISQNAGLSECDLVLKRSFYKHISLVKRKWPYKKGNQVFNLAYISYIAGIKKIKI